MDLVTIVLLISLSIFTIWGFGKEVNSHFVYNLFGIGGWCMGFNFPIWMARKENLSDAYTYISSLMGSGFAIFVGVFSALVALIGIGGLVFGIKETASDVGSYFWRNKPSSKPTFDTPEEEVAYYAGQVQDIRSAANELAQESPELAQALLNLAEATAKVHRLEVETKKPPIVPKKTSRKEIDRWTLGKHLGGGNFSDVYLATRKTKGPIDEVEIAALKIMKPKALTGISLERFRQEMAIIAKFDHASVIRLVDYPKRKDSKEMWMATNFVSEWNFEDLIARNGKFSGRELNNFVRQLFNGLEHAARRDVIHGDIKPANLLLSRDGDTLVIADFGLAFNRKKQVADIHTDISYRAPELFFPEGDLTHASDVYSAAIAIFEMASGRKVWAGTNDLARVKTLAVNYGPSWEGVPVHVREFIKPMLAANPDDRPKLNEISTHLREYNISPWKKGTKYFEVAAEYTQRQSVRFNK